MSVATFLKGKGVESKNTFPQIINFVLPKSYCDYVENQCRWSEEIQSSIYLKPFYID